MPDAILALVAFLLPLAWSPGPGNLFFAALGGRFGVRAAGPAMGGYHAATWAVTMAIGLGFGGLSAAWPEGFVVIRHLGAAYVMWLALRFLRAGVAAGPGPAQPATWADGAALLVFNPKAYVIVGLMFTQFLDAGDRGAAAVAEVAWIATVFTLNNLVAFLAWTMLGDVLLRQFRDGRRARALNVAFAGLLACVAVWMLVR